MGRRKVNYKSKLNKKKFLKRRRKKRIRSIFSLLFIVFIIFTYNKIFSKEKENISPEIIKYYIEMADNNSKELSQLNWMEIAAIDAATNDKRFIQGNDSKINKISQSFYKENTNEKKSIRKVIKDLNLSKGQREDAFEILNDLQGINLRGIYEGENSEKDEFINSLREASINSYKKYGVLPSITIAQAILESDYGRSTLASTYKNYFGIKADSSWTGSTVSLETRENYNEVIKAKFRAYNTIEESIFDLGKFLNNNSRYRNYGFFNGKNYREQAIALENAGYATVKNENGEPIYADLLIEVIKENNLMLFDTMI